MCLMYSEKDPQFKWPPITLCVLGRELQQTQLCAAVGTASHQYGLEACTVYGDTTVCSCRHSKWFSMGQKRVLCMETLLCPAVGTANCLVWVRSVYCVWRHSCVQLQAQQVIQYGLEACTVYGDTTVSSCRHTKSFSMGQKRVPCMETLLCPAVGTASHQHGSEACTVYGRYEITLQND